MNLIIYKIFFILSRIRKNNYNKNNIQFKLTNKIIGYIEAYYNLIIVKKYKKSSNNSYGLNTCPRKRKIIISFTSFPERIDTVWIVVESLFKQSMKPDKIILWLANNQFKNKNSLPKRLLEQEKRGLTIKFCNDLKSHKKYFYTMKEFPDDYIILVDDDVIYSEDLIEKLWKLHINNPSDICCMTPCLISPGFKSAPSLWRSPFVDEKIEHSLYAQPFTGQGTLYPPNSISEEAFDEKKVMELCPYADDLWLKFMSLKKGVAVTSIYKYRPMPINIYGTSESSLWYINAPGGKNDEQWSNIIKEYEDDFNKLEEKYEHDYKKNIVD